MREFNYENKDYLEKLNELHINYYSKYIKYIKKFIAKNSIFLDVGCGNGEVLRLLKDQGYINGYGVEISKLFINEAKSKGLNNVYYYDGTTLPFNDLKFDLIGSFNVLEHTFDPEMFIKSQIDKIKVKGILIIACPNFLSVLFPSSNRRLKGLKRKTSNFLMILSKIICPGDHFERMDPIIRKKFEYDDDAIVVTNILDLKNILKQNNCKILYESGFINYDSSVFRVINSIPLVKYLLPSCFIVARKIK